MSPAVAVTATIVEGDNNGCFLRVQTMEEHSRVWSKWYPSPQHATIDGEVLGLTEREEFFTEPLAVTIRRRFKSQSVIDPDNLIHFGFRQIN